MDRSQKQKVVESLNRSLQTQSVVVITRQSGLTAGETADLRRKMRAAQATFKVTKNRLARLALKGTQFEHLADLFKGPTAIASSVDPVAAAKAAFDYANQNDKLVIVGGALGGKLLDAEGIKTLAKLPSLNELRGKLIGMLQTPATRVASVLAAPAGQLARLLKAKADKGEAA
ncbi:MAG: 50S ribosomal protein L10 [Alphaproteobacteria bacterium]|nr:50S ribosomal protein L10 [Alphaproteobacteria bacterium]